MKNILSKFKNSIYVFFLATFFMVVGFINNGEKVEGAIQVGAMIASHQSVGARDISYTVQVGTTPNYNSVIGATVYYGFNSSSYHCNTNLPNSFTATELNYHALKGFTTSGAVAFAIELYESGLVGTQYFHAYAVAVDGSTNCFNSSAFEFADAGFSVAASTTSPDVGDTWINYKMSIRSVGPIEDINGGTLYYGFTSSSTNSYTNLPNSMTVNVSDFDYRIPNGGEINISETGLSGMVGWTFHMYFIGIGGRTASFTSNIGEWTFASPPTVTLTVADKIIVYQITPNDGTISEAYYDIISGTYNNYCPTSGTDIPSDNMSGAILSPSESGYYTVGVKAINVLGKSACSSTIITVDVGGVEIDGISIDFDGYARTHYLTLWAYDDISGIDRYLFKFSKSSVPSCDSDMTTRSVTYPYLKYEIELKLSGEDGTWYLHIIVYDTSGNSSDCRVSDPIYMDNTAPSVGQPSFNSVSCDRSMDVSVVDSHVSVSVVKYCFEGSGTCDISDYQTVSASFSVTFFGSYSGTFYIRIYVEDSVGNSATVYFSFVTDCDGPSIVVDVTPDGLSSSKDIDVTVTDSYSNIYLVTWCYQTENGECDITNWQTASTSFSLTFSYSESGKFCILVVAEDTAGNSSYASECFTIDPVSPSVGSLSVDDSYYDTSHSVTVSMSDDYALSSYSYKFSWYSSDSCDSGMTSVNLNSETTFSISLTLSSGSGMYYLHIVVYDLVGNSSGCSSSSALYMDNSSPNISINVSPSSVSQSKDISVSVSDSYVNVSSVEWCYETQSGTCDVTSYTTASTSFSLIFDYEYTGKYCVRVYARDSLWNSTSTYSCFTVDNDDPDISISLDSTDFEKSHTVNVSVDDYSTVSTYYLWDRDSSNSCVYETYLDTNSLTLDWENGVWYLHIYSEDAAGNSSCAVSSAVKFLIASIGSNKYGYLQDAIDASSSGDTVVLENYDSECVTIPSSKNITINLNGNHLNCYTSNDAKAIDNSGTLLLTDTTGGNGYITARSVSANAYGVYNNDGASLVVDGGGVNAFAYNGDAYGVYGSNVTIGDQSLAISTTNPVIRGEVGVHSTSNFSFYNGAIWGINESYSNEPTSTRGEWVIIEDNGTYDSKNYAIKRYFLGVDVTVNGATTTYPTINSAFSNVTVSNTVSMKLLDNINECNVVSNKNVVFDLNGHKWMCNPIDNYDNLLIVNGGDLVLKDLVNARGVMSYTFGYQNPSTMTSYVAIVVNSGTLTFKNIGLTVRENNAGAAGGIAIRNSGNTIIDDNNALIDIDGGSGGQVYGVVNSGTLTVNKGKVMSVTHSDGKAVGVDSEGQVNLNGGEIYAEVDYQTLSTYSGAYGIYGGVSPIVNIKKGIIRATSKSSNDYKAYGIYMNGSGSLTIGEDEGYVEEDTVTIRGRDTGIIVGSAQDFKWFDGTIGGVNASYDRGPTETFANAEILTRTESYNGETYNVAYIKPPAVIVDYNGQLTSYMEFSDALNSITDSGLRTMRIMKDLTGICNYTIASGRNIIIDLNGKSISCTTSSSGAYVFNVSGNLTIKDSIGGGTINMNTSSAITFYGLYSSTSGAKIIIESGEINVKSTSTSSSSYYAYGVYISGGSSLEVKGGKINVNKNYYVYGVYATGTSTSYTQSGGEIFAQTVYGSSYGMYAYAGNIVIKGGKIIGTNTNSGYTVYGIYSRGDSTSYKLTFGESGGTISQEDPYISGGIYVYSTSAYLYFYDGIIDSGYNNYTCNGSSYYCSNYFDAIESGTVWVDDHNKAFIGFVIEELDANGNHVAYHDTVANAFVNSTNGNIVKILENLTVCNVSLSSGKNLILDLNGKTLSCSTSSNNTKVITVEGTLTVRDSAGGGAISITSSYRNVYALYSITRGATIIIESGKIILESTQTSSSSSYKAVAIYSENGNVDIRGGEISSKRNYYAYGVYLSGASAKYTQIGGSISATSTSGAAYGLYQNGIASSIISAGIITSTSTGGISYGVYAYAILNSITGGTITGISTSGTKYGVYNAGTSSLYVTTFGVKDGKLSQSEPYIVGGLYVNSTGAKLNFYDGKINKGKNSYACNNSSSKCSTYFDNIEDGTYWVDNSTDAYLQFYAAKEVNSLGNVINYYNTVQEGLNGALNGSTISLLIDANECLTYSGSNTIILDLNDKNISCDNTATSAIITNSGNLTIKGQGKIIAINSSGTMYGIKNTGTLKLMGVDVTTTSGNPLVYAIHSTGNLSIGESGGYFSIERPFINGTVYKGSDGAIFSFYEGRIYSNANACATSSGQTACSSIFNSIETGATWVESNEYAYLSVSVASVVTTSGSTTYYGSLQEAINNATTGDTVYLLFNIDECVVINAGKVITLALNGNSIMCSGVNINGDSVAIINKGSVIIYGGTIKGDSKEGSYAILNEGILSFGNEADAGEEYPYVYGDIRVNSSSELLFNAGRIYDSCLLDGEVVSCVNIIDYIPEGYVLYDNGEYVFLLAYEDSLAVEINGDGLVVRVLAEGSVYTLATFITNATSGNTVKLYADNTLCLTNSKVLILDLNGHAISCTSGTAITNSGTLTVQGNGTINSTTTSANVYGINNTGTLTVENTIINAKYTSTSTSYYSYGIYSSAGSITLTNVDITSSSYAYAYGLYITSTGNLTISGGTINVTTTYTSTSTSTGIYAIRPVEMTSTEITVTGKYYTYGINNSSTFVMNSGKVTVNGGISTTYGVYIANGSSFTMNDGEVSATSTSGTAYAMYAYGYTNTIKAGKISATSTSGGVYGVYNSGSSSSYTTTFGVKDGIYTKTGPEIVGGVYVSNTSAYLYFYDGIIKSGKNNYTCNSSSNKCSSYFDAIEEGYSWVEDNSQAYLGVLMEELDSTGNHVAYHSSLTNAFSNAANGNTIRLLENINACNITLSSGKTLTIDMNGKKIVCAMSGQEIKGIINNGNLTIVGEGSLEVDQSYDSYNGTYGYVYGIYNTGTLSIDGLNIFVKSQDTANDSNSDTYYETETYVYGIYNSGVLSFISGKIDLDWYGTTYLSDFIFYGIRSAGASATSIITIGAQGGVPSKTSPEINESIYVDSTNATLNFYDGIIKKGHNSYVCNSSGTNRCASYFDNIETGYGWMDDGSVAYLTIVMEELNSSGGHVAYYSDFTAAFTNATNGNTIKMLDNFTVCNVTLAAGKEFILDLNGKTLSCNLSSTGVKVFSISGSLTIMDSAEGGTISLNTSTYTVYGIYINSGGVVTLNSGLISSISSYSSSGYYNSGVYNLGTINVNGGKIYAQQPYHSVGVYNYNSTSKLVLNGGEIESKATNTSYGVYGAGSTIEMNGGKIIVRASSASYGVLNQSSSTFTMNDGEISSTTTGSYSYGVHNNSNSTMEMNGGKIISNSSSQYSYGVLNQNSSIFTMNDGEISSTATSAYSHGVTNNATFNLNGGTINSKSNSTLSYGVNNTSSYIQSGGSVTSTTVTGSAYGLYAYGTVNTIKGGSITATNTNTGYTVYGVYNYGQNSSYVTTFGESGGVPSKTNPEINGGVYVYSTNATLYFYDGIIKNGYNSYTCNSSSAKCSTYFDAIEPGYGWFDSGSEAYLDILIEEVNESGSRVATHSTLAAAFSNGTNGNIIKPLVNLYECGASLPSGKELTLDLNGKTITCNSINSNTKVLNITGNLIIMDSVGEGSINLSTTSYRGSVLYINSGGVVTLNSGLISSISSYPNSGYYNYGVYNLGTINVNGGKIYAQQPYYSVGVYNPNSTSKLVLNGGEIESKATNSTSYGVYGAGSTIEMNGGKIIVRASSSSYGVLNQSSSTFTMNDGEISSTVTSSNSYGVNNSATFNLNGGTINSKSNNSTSYGVYNTSSYIQSGGNVTSTTVTGSAYGLYAYGTVNTIKGGSITATNTNTGYTVYGVYNAGSSTSYVTTFGESGGVPSKTNPEINGGLYVANTSATLYFYDGIIKKGYNSYTCNSSSSKCSNYFDAIETGFAWVDNGSEAYLSIVIEEFNDNGEHVAYHSTLSAAFSNGVSGNTIKMLENLSGTATLASGKTLTLDMNGKSFSSTNSTMLTINGNLNIIGGGTLSVTYTSSTVYGIQNSGNLIIFDTNISVTGSSSESSYNAYGINNSGTLQVFNTSIIVTVRAYGYGIYNTSSGTATISDGSINVTTTYWDSYGIYNQGNVTVSNEADINSSSSGDDTWGVYSNGTLLISSGARITANSATSSYTAYGVYASGTATIQSGTITSKGSGVKYGVYSAGSSSSHSLQIGSRDGKISQSDPYIVGGVYVSNTSAVLSFFDGKINKGVNSYTCQTSSASCSSYFDNIEDGATWYDDHTDAYLLGSIQEENSNGEVVAIYGRLQAAFDNMVNGNILKLLKNISDMAVIFGSKEAIVDLNSYTLSSSDSSSTIMFNLGKLTIRGEGKISLQGIDSDELKYVISNTGSLIVESGTIELSVSNGTGYAIDNETNGYVEFKGGKISATSTSSAALVSGIFNDGTVTMSGGEIEVIHNPFKAIGVYNYGTFNMNGGEISASSDNGYSCGVGNLGTMNMNDGTITSVGSRAEGISNFKTFTMNDGEVYVTGEGSVVSVGIFSGESSSTNPADIDNVTIINGGNVNVQGTGLVGIYANSGNTTINNVNVVVESSAGSSIGVYSNAVIDGVVPIISIKNGNIKATSVSSGALAAGVGTSGTLIIGEKGGQLSQESPYFEGNLFNPKGAMSNMEFYDGKVKGQCENVAGVAVVCSQVINTIEDRTYIVEENGYIYLDYKNVEEVTSTGTFVKYYPSLQKAFTNVVNGNTLKLLYDLEECNVSLASEKNTILDLNNYSLSCVTSNIQANAINNYGTLTIQGEGKISIESEDAIVSAVYSALGSLTIISGNIEAKSTSRSAYGINVYSGVATVNGGKINGGIYNNPEGRVIISDGEIVGNVYNCGALEINGGKISNNYYAVSNFSSGTLVVNGGEILVNGEEHGASGIYNESGSVEINDVYIYVFSQTAIVYGIENYSGTVEINGGKIEANSISGTANGIFNRLDSSILVINDGEIVANVISSGQSIGVNSISGAVEINGGSIRAISSSTSWTNGVYSNALLEINGGNIYCFAEHSNCSGVSGGVSATLQINGGEILVENISERLADGVDNSGQVTIAGGIVSVVSEGGTAIGILNNGAALMEGGVVSATSTNIAYGVKAHTEFILLGGSISAVGVSETYGVYTSGTLTVGAKDGRINNEIPFINGGIYIVSGANVSFYDGRIHAVSYTCKSSTGVEGCALLIEEIEEGSSWLDADGVAYIAKIIAQEETISGEIVRDYASLQTAINSASNGNIIRLIGNVKECVLVQTDKILILDLNGFGIKCESENMDVTSTIENKGQLTIRGSGLIEAISEFGEIVGITNEGTLTLNGGTISVLSTSQKSVGMRIVSGSVCINGGVVNSSSTNNDAVGIEVEEGAILDLQTGVVSVVSNTKDGIGIINRGTVEIVSGAISVAGESGNLIGINNEGAIAIQDGVVNVVSESGESVGIVNSGNIEIEDGVISSNKGYAIEANEGAIVYSGGKLQGSRENKYTYNVSESVTFDKGNKNEWTEISEDGSMYITVLVDEAIKVGTVAYGSLKEALIAAENGATINIVNNVTSEAIEINKQVTINTNGYILNNYVYSIYNMEKEDYEFIKVVGGKLIVEGEGEISSEKIAIKSEAGKEVVINGGKISSRESNIIDIKNKDLYVKEGNYVSYSEEEGRYIMEVKEGSKVNESGGLTYKVGVDSEKVVIELNSTININTGDRLVIYLRSVSTYEYVMSCKVDESELNKVICESEVEGLTYVYNMNYEDEMLIIYEDVDGEKVVAKEILRKDLKMTPNLLDNSGEAKFRIEGEGYSVISDGEIILVDVYGGNVGYVDLDKNELKTALFGPNYTKIFTNLSFNMGMPIDSCGGGFITCMDLDVSGSYASSYPVSTSYSIQIIMYDYRPKLVTSEVEELENKIECEQGEVCNIESLSFVDYKGEEVETETIVMRDGVVVEAVDTSQTGRYTIINKAMDKLGNESKEVIRELVIVDKQAPVVRVSKIEGKIGKEIDIMQDIEVKDNNDDNLEIEVIENTVNVNKEGVYTVGYKVVDESGNESIVYRQVEIKDINLVNIYHVIMGMVVAIVVGLIGCVFVRKRYTC